MSMLIIFLWWMFAPTKDAGKSKHHLKKEGATGLTAGFIEILNYYVSSQPHCFMRHFPCGNTFRTARAQNLIFHPKSPGKGMSQKLVPVSDSSLVLLSLNKNSRRGFRKSAIPTRPLTQMWAALITQVMAYLLVCKMRHSLNARRFFLTHAAIQGQARLQVGHVLPPKVRCFC